MSVVSKIGADACALVDGFDLSRGLRQLRHTSLLGAVQCTKFQPPEYSHEYTAGLRGGATGFSGDLPIDSEDALFDLQNEFADDSTPKIIFIAPSGAAPGNLARIGKSLQSAYSDTIEAEGLLTFDADFEKTASSPGVISGTSLFTPHGDDTITRNTIARIALTDVEEPTVLEVFNADGDSLGTIDITPGDATADIKAALEALPEITTVSVSGSSTELYGADVAGDATVTVSSSSSGSAADIIDDQSATSWVSNTSETGWVKFHLADAATIGKLILTGGDNSDSPKNFTVEGSATGDFTGEQTVLKTVTNRAYSLAATEHILDVLQEFEWIRIDITATLGGANNPRIAEVELIPLTPSTGNYAIEVTAPSQTVFSFEEAGATGYALTRSQVGGTVTRLNKVSATETGTNIVDPSISTDATSTRGAMAVLHVIEAAAAAAVSKTITVLVEHSPDDGDGNPTVWSTLLTFDAMTDTGAQVKLVNAGTTIHPHVRARVSAVTGDFAIAVGWGRRH